MREMEGMYRGLGKDERVSSGISGSQDRSAYGLPEM